MARTKTVFVCTACGTSSPRWLGKCPACGTWDALEEHRQSQESRSAKARPLIADLAPDPAAPMGSADESSAVSIDEAIDSETRQPRWSTGIGELDRVLGGGLVAGSAVLLGGPPGVGKSTLMLHVAQRLSASTRNGIELVQGRRVLYVSSEESVQQVAMRASRIGDRGADATNNGDGARVPQALFLFSDANLARVFEQVRQLEPDVLVLDSVQMIYRPDLEAAPGSMAQLRRCCADLVLLAKSTGCAVLMVGHVTKDGMLAGPKLLEHLVDVVLQCEGDRSHTYRLVRATKNRFGRAGELGVFEMTGAGMRELPEGAAPWLADDAWTRPRPGSVLAPLVTGARCVLVELQALTATGFLGAAKRKASGIDPSRLAMLIAVLESHADMRLADRDVFASSVGGLRVTEPAGDLALLLAIAGAERRQSLPPRSVAIGEVGLDGRIRPVPLIDQRLREAARLGCTHAFVPARQSIDAHEGISIQPVADVSGAISHLQ